MSGWRLKVALIASIVFAFPIVTLVSSFVVFPIVFYGALAIIANFAPVAILASAGLTRLGMSINRTPLIEAWLYCGTIWIGCAYGLSHWGDVGGTIGAQNQPYFEMLFAPWRILIAYLIR